MMPGKIPRYAIPIVGKAAEIAEITARLDTPACQLLTLLGPGGIGKTRLAVEIASQPDHNFEDGIYFIELQPLLSPDTVVQAIASALTYEFQDNNDLHSELLSYLHDKHLLLILDNFEHLLPAREFVSSILDDAPCVKVLVTSRECLKLRAEWIHEVAGLTYPPQAFSNPVETYTAVQLFTDHARRARHDFSLHRDVEGVVRICELTGGIPLAIELAAAWVRSLSCAQIADEIQHHLDFLGTDLHDMPDRHRTMKAVFDHSWQMLSEEERNVMMGLSVFRGGFLRDAATQVTGASLKTLSALVDKSLLRMDHTGRYEIHELQRQYAEALLKKNPERRRQFYDAHCAHFSTFMNVPESDLLGKDNIVLLRAMDEDINNIRLAWDWSLNTHRFDDLKKMMDSLYYYTWLRSGYKEGVNAFQRAVATLRECGEESARVALGYALLCLGAMYLWSGQSKAQALALAEESVAILRAANARPELAQAVGVLGWVHFTKQEWDDAVTCLEESVVLKDEFKQHELQGFNFELLGNIALHRGRYEDAQDWFKRALLLGQEIGDNRTIASMLYLLGNITMRRGNYMEARQLFERSLLVAREHDLYAMTISALNHLGYVTRCTANLSAACGYFQESLAIAKEYDKGAGIVYALNGLADVKLAQDDVIAAKAYYEEAFRIANTRLDGGQVLLAIHAGLADVALRTGDYDRALTLYFECLNNFREIEDQTSVATMLTKIGLAQVMQGEKLQPRENFLEALQIAVRLDAPPLMLEILSGIAMVLMSEGNLSHAVELATLVLRHPASNSDSKAHARQVLTQSEVELFATDLEVTVRQSVLADLDAVCEQLIEQLQAHIEQPLVEPLSERELEVLQRVAHGRSNREIASDLTLALGTVKSHLHNILQKLEADNRTEAVARARDLRLL